jgi:tripartite-type tricarboxylate transporter receptor subunit TctC
LKRRTGIDVVRVTYRSNPAAMTDLIAGHVPAMIPDFWRRVPQVKAQKIRPLAVLTRERSTTLPDVPTLHETVLPNYDLLAWAGLFRAREPAAANRCASFRRAREMLSRPDVKERFLTSGVEVAFSGPQEFDAYVKSELVKWTG